MKQEHVVRDVNLNTKSKKCDSDVTVKGTEQNNAPVSALTLLVADVCHGLSHPSMLPNTVTKEAEKCCYCGCAEVSSIVQCCVPTCMKWFCNGRTDGLFYTHIIMHMIHAEHTEVRLHPRGLLRNTALESFDVQCSQCSRTDAFALCFLFKKSSGLGPLYLCNGPCIKGFEYRTIASGDDWKSVVNSLQLSQCLVTVPDIAATENIFQITFELIQELEDLWETNPQGTIDDLAMNFGSNNQNSPLINESSKTTAMSTVSATNMMSRMSISNIMDRTESKQNKIAEFVASGSTLRKNKSGNDFTSKSESSKQITGTESAMEKLSINACPSLPTVFTASSYASFFTPLVEMGLDESKKTESMPPFLDVEIKWRSNVLEEENSICVGVASLKVIKTTKELKKGTMVEIFHPSLLTNGKLPCGLIMDTSEIVKNVIDVTIEVFGNPSIVNTPYGFTVFVMWNGVTYLRMLKAITLLTTDNAPIDSNLQTLLLGTNTETACVDKEHTSFVEDLSTPGIVQLNPMQERTVRNALVRPLTLIQGPPGTGKSKVATVLVYQMFQLHKERILVTAPSNVAVDHLSCALHSTGLNVVRVCSWAREKASPSVIKSLLIGTKIENAIQIDNRWQALKTLRQKKHKTILDPEEQTRYQDLYSKLEMEIILSADIICTTCVGAGAPCLSEFRFKHVVIDESAQACEPETLIPLVLGCRQAVLIGDHCQLGPVIICPAAQKLGLARSLFERLILLGARPFRLQIQYRMHPSIAEFPANTFYEGTLQNGVTHNDRIMRQHYFPWPQENRPMFFYNTQGQEEISASGTSYLNRTEAALVEHCVTQLLRGGVTPDHIGVITPYRGQSIYVANYLSRNGPMPADLYRRIEIFSVDAFQGREKQYIIFTCVRSNMHQGIGFLKDARRLNVALTRAQYGLIIIGNARVLSREPLWHSLLSHFKERNLIVEGPLQTLRAIEITLPKPRALTSDDPMLPPPTSATGPSSFSNGAGGPTSYPSDFDGSTAFVSAPSALESYPLSSGGYDSAMLAASNVAVNAAISSTEVVSNTVSKSTRASASTDGPEVPAAKSFLMAAQQYLDQAPGGTEFYAKNRAMRSGW